MKQDIHFYQKLGKNQKAFTLVEVMLFLAIAGMVFFIGINAVGGRTAQVQFTDSMRSLNDFVKAQYNEFFAGARPYDNLGCTYPVAPGGPSIGSAVNSDGSCVLFGKVLVFQAGADPVSSVVTTYNLVARNLSSDEFAANPSCSPDNFSCLDAAVIENVASVAPETYQILWGVNFVKGNERNHGLFGNSIDPFAAANQTRDNVRAMGWLKNPQTNAIIPAVFGASDFTAANLNDPTIYRSHKDALDSSVIPRVAWKAEFNSAFCFESPNDELAMLVLGEDESQEVVNLVFGRTTTFHDCTP